MHGGRIKLVNRLAPRSLTARGVSPRPSPAPRPTLKLYSPQGNKKPGHHIRRIEDQTSSELVGQGWVGRATEGALGLAWLYDIEIMPTHRGQGHGRAAMTLIATEAKLLGACRT